MINLIFSNPKIGDIDLITDKYVRLTSIEGVGSDGMLATQLVAGRDGGTLSSKTLPPRQIIVNFRIRAGVDAEQAMHDMYRIFAFGASGTMQFVGRLGSSFIDYIVENIDIPPNKQQLSGTMTLKCLDPYFRAGSSKTAVIAGSVSMFTFPFTFPEGGFYISQRLQSLFADVYNEGEADTGCTIVFKARADVVNPALIDAETGKTAKFNLTMKGGDEIRITTGKNNKRVTLIRDGIETNIFGKTMFPFTFFQLSQGRNTYKYDADAGLNSLDVDIEYTEKFGAMYTNAPGAAETRVPDEVIESYIEEIARIIKRGGLDYD